METLIVGLGGALGSVIRFSLGRFINSNVKTGFPIATFVINITGAFFLGVVNSVTLQHNLYLLLADGFLGGYTTFSTLMYEGFGLLTNSNKKLGSVYWGATLVGGVLAFVIGLNLY